jgi:hypothetical protein
MTQCELCGNQLAGDGAKIRLAHLRQTHSGYARGLLLRMAAPFVFLLLVLAASATGAPSWVYPAALVVSVVVMLAGRRIARGARREAGAAPSVPVGRLIKDGGFRFVLMIPALMLLLIFLSRK